MTLLRGLPAVQGPVIRAVIFAGPVAHLGVDINRALDRAINRCRRYADSMQMDVVSVRREKRPAALGLARPSIGRLIRDASNNRYDVLLVDRIRRLGIPPSTAMDLVRRIESTGVHVVAVLPDAGPDLAAAIAKFGLSS